MSLTTDFHIKTIWFAIATMVVGWFGGMSWSVKQHEILACEMNQIKYDNGVRLASIEATLKQVNVSLIEIKREIPNLRYKGVDINDGL